MVSRDQCGGSCSVNDYRVGNRVPALDTFGISCGPNDGSASGREPILPMVSAKPLEIHDDPVDDGWHAEAFHRKAATQLHVLRKTLFFDVGSMLQMSLPITNDFTCASLRPAPLELIAEDRSFSVSRLELSPELDAEQEVGAFQGPHGLNDAVQRLAQLLDGNTDTQVSLKTFDLQRHSTFVTTKALVEASNQFVDHAIQIRAVWALRWKIYEPGDPPLLDWIGVEKHEEVLVRTERPLFADCTEAVFKADPTFPDNSK